MVNVFFRNYFVKKYNVLWIIWIGDALTIHSLDAKSSMSVSTNIFVHLVRWKHSGVLAVLSLCFSVSVCVPRPMQAWRSRAGSKIITSKRRLLISWKLKSLLQLSKEIMIDFAISQVSIVVPLARMIFDAVDSTFTPRISISGREFGLDRTLECKIVSYLFPSNKTFTTLSWQGAPAFCTRSVVVELFL